MQNDVEEYDLDECADCGKRCYLAGHSVIECQEQQLANKDALIGELVEAAEFLNSRVTNTHRYIQDRIGGWECTVCYKPQSSNAQIEHSAKCPYGNALKKIAEAKEALNAR
ncbi:MAG: hypothetical protein WC455_11590 [Dehalococcoidia bacterium]|jgi:hypothetical protein